MMRNLMMFILISLLTACATSPFKVAEKIKPGMEKPDVLEALGNPNRTRRVKMQDQWEYVFYKQNDMRVFIVYLENNKVQQTAWLSTEEKNPFDDVKNLEEFEQKAREKQQKKKGNFKPLGGEESDPQ